MKIFNKTYGRVSDSSIFVGLPITTDEDMIIRLQAVAEGISKTDKFRQILQNHISKSPPERQLISELVSKALAVWRLEVFKYKRFDENSNDKIKKALDEFIEVMEFDLNKCGISKPYINKVIDQFKNFVEREEKK